MTREEKVAMVTKIISEGGWSSLYSFVDQLSDDELNDRLPEWLFCYDCGVELNTSDDTYDRCLKSEENQKKMSKITEKRLAFKPFEYQWAYDYWFQQQNAHWLHTEINMQKDIKDWNEELTDVEKATIGEILKGFAQTETAVEDYWSGYIPKWFPKPEIKMMAVTFGAFETIHATALTKKTNIRFDMNEQFGIFELCKNYIKYTG